MATEEDLKKAEAEEESGESPDDAEAGETPEKGEGALVRVKADSDADEAKDTKEEETVEDDGAPVQLGYQRYVYAAYMAGAMLVGFLAAKIGHAAWYRLGQWKPELGEPKDEVLFPVAGVIGVLVA